MNESGIHFCLHFLKNQVVSKTFDSVVEMLCPHYRDNACKAIATVRFTFRVAKCCHLFVMDNTTWLKDCESTVTQ